MRARRLGYVVTCIDRRYWQTQIEEIRKVTGLKETDFWLEALPGGVGKLVEEQRFTGLKHAIHSGADIVVAGMHGDGCGGYPGKTNEQLQKSHQEAISVLKKAYPEVELWSVWSTGKQPDVTTIIKKL